MNTYTVTFQVKVSSFDTESEDHTIVLAARGVDPQHAIANATGALQFVLDNERQLQDSIRGLF